MDAGSNIWKLARNVCLNKNVVCYPPYFFRRNEIEISRNRTNKSLWKYVSSTVIFLLMKRVWLCIYICIICIMYIHIHKHYIIYLNYRYLCTNNRELDLNRAIVQGQSEWQRTYAIRMPLYAANIWMDAVITSERSEWS